jgi:ribosome-associated heat shock protein Hsp15
MTEKTGSRAGSSAQPGGESGAGSNPPEFNELESLRLDIWLDVACLFKTRSQAQTACRAGKVDVNDQRGKPNRLIRPGDLLRISRTGWKQIVELAGLHDQHNPKAQARKLYVDQTPEPSPEELEVRRLMRDARIHAPAERPDKRERRELRRLKRQ